MVQHFRFRGVTSALLDTKLIRLGYCISVAYPSSKKVGILLVQLISTCTDEKENQIFPIYKEIQEGAVAKSYMTNGLLIYGEIFAHFLIYVLGSPSAYMTLQLLHSEFPYL